RFPGFTLIEILLVMAILGLMLSVTLPISYDMYRSYKASLRAEEVMMVVSGLKRESFLYNERKILTSENGVMRVNGEEKTISEAQIRIDTPIEFYKNGTTSGGILTVVTGNQVYEVQVQAPLGNLSLERKGEQRS
ncbi:MAG: putative rane protein, partial [Deltaproteobacteria bacterium]|nr:putative rane protein [Deltaproteobacteria bacterium]